MAGRLNGWFFFLLFVCLSFIFLYATCDLLDMRHRSGDVGTWTHIPHSDMCKLENCFSILCCHAWIRFRMRIWFNFSSQHVLVLLCPTLHHRMSHTSARYILFIEFKRYLFASVVCFVALRCVRAICDVIFQFIFFSLVFCLLSSALSKVGTRSLQSIRCSAMLVTLSRARVHVRVVPVHTTPESITNDDIILTLLEQQREIVKRNDGHKSTLR